MSAGPASLGAGLTTALLVEAARALLAVPEAERPAARDLVAAWLDDPRPSTFMAASRALRAARRSAAAARLIAARDERTFERGRAALEARPELADRLDALAALPRDGRTGKRLLAIAQLLEAQEELLARAAAATRALRRQLRPPVAAPPARPRSARA